MPAHQHFELQTGFFAGLHECEQQRSTLHKVRVCTRQCRQIYYDVRAESFGTLHKLHSASCIRLVGILDVVGGSALHKHPESALHELSGPFGGEGEAMVSGTLGCRQAYSGLACIGIDTQKFFKGYRGVLSDYILFEGDARNCEVKRSTASATWRSASSRSASKTNAARL